MAKKFVVEIICCNICPECGRYVVSFQDKDWTIPDLPQTWEGLQRRVRKMVEQKLLADHYAVDVVCKTVAEGLPGIPLLWTEIIMFQGGGEIRRITTPW